MWLILVLIVILAIWSMQYRNTGGPLLSPSGSSGTREIRLEQVPTQSPNTGASTKSSIALSPANVLTAVADQEYITLSNTGDTAIDLSGAKLGNKRNESVTISTDLNGNTITLAPREKAIVVSGRNAGGGNFKINSCSGYFAQFQKFVPPLSSFCPQLIAVDDAKNLDTACRNYIGSLPSCQFPSSIPTNISSVCNDFIQKHAGYQACTQDHKNDKDFDRQEWRIYLNRGTELWLSENDTIKLFDASGKKLAEESY